MFKGVWMILITVFLTLGLFSLSTAEESITITTYYPSPYGSYNNLYVANNAGIGTTGPTYNLEVNGTMHIDGTNIFSFNTPTGGYISYLQLTDATFGNFIIQGAMGTNDAWQIFGDGGLDNGVLHIRTVDNNAEPIYLEQGTNVRLAIASNGNVGIGTASPGNYKLNVSGDAMVNRIYTQAASSAHGLGHNFSDIAEDIIADGCEAGDVVVVNPSNNESVFKSTKPYDTTVAGIISETPAFYIGKRDKAPYLPLALAGRVYCKVTIENGPIKRGDFLTSSSLPGHAMKATDKKKSTGAIVGKALGSFDGGSDGKKTGKIMALVTLQ